MPDEVVRFFQALGSTVLWSVVSIAIVAVVFEVLEKRYHLMDENTMRIIITINDPIFLTKPFKYALIVYKRPGGMQPGWWQCDPQASREETEGGYPGRKYKDNK